MGKKKKDDIPAPEADETVTGAEETDESEVTGEPETAVDAEPVEPDFQAEAAQNKDLYLRALADLENYRKRALREKEDAIRFANNNLLQEMIPVIDNLERAIEHADGTEGQDQGLLEGVQMTLGQFRKVLETFGVKAIDCIGLPFDPNFHQAMGEMVTADQPPNCVAQELQKGYTLNDRLVRPALVMIARAPEVEANAEEDETVESTENEAEPDSGPDTEDSI